MTSPSTKVALVTGASSGIGWALAAALSKEGYRLGLLARRRDKLYELAGLIHQQGGVAELAVADVGDWGQMQSASAALRAALGPIDLLVANAGVGQPVRLPAIDVPGIDAMLRINVLGVIHAFSAVLPEMIERRQGHLAAVSSLAAYKGLPGESAYGASKAAVNTFCEGLRIQLRPHGIAVTTINPGFVRTPMIASHDFYMPGMMSAEEAARRIVVALRRRRKVFDFPLQTRLLMKLTRWLPDWLMAWGMQGYTDREGPGRPEVGR